jgi:hypothetical protein
MIRIDISGVESSLLLSEYGERMHWSCAVPNMDFDPGDHYPLVLRINCLNSVDTSTVLEITFSWYRLICSNGMMLERVCVFLRRHIVEGGQVRPPFNVGQSHPSVRYRTSGSCPPIRLDRPEDRPSANAAYAISTGTSTTASWWCRGSRSLPSHAVRRHSGKRVQA